MSIYIAREDFLNGIPRDEYNDFVDGAFFGQLALDSNDHDDQVLFCWIGDRWLDMTSVVANFGYCGNADIDDIFDIISNNDMRPLTWDSYDDSRKVCEDEYHTDYNNGYGCNL